MTSVNKVQFASMNNKRYYLLNGIVSLPYRHPLLSKIPQIKKFYPKIHSVIEQEKSNMLKLKQLRQSRCKTRKAKNFKINQHPAYNIL